MHRMLIDGKLVTADRTYPSVNPATGQVFNHAPDASVADAQAAIAAARRAFDTTSWATDVAFRVRCLDQLHHVLTEHKEELRELTIADVGAPRAITYGAQLEEPIAIVRYYADLLPGYPLTQELGLTTRHLAVELGVAEKRGALAVVPDLGRLALREELLLAHVAAPAGDVERDYDPVAGLDVAHLGTDGLDNPHRLVTEDVAFVHEGPHDLV